MGQCMKCGKETAGKAVFCDTCQSIMEAHPVKPGTVIHILPRPEKRPQRHKEPTKAEQLAKSRKTVKWLLGLVATLSVLLIIMATMLMRTLSETDGPTAPIGRNYTTIETSQ